MTLYVGYNVVIMSAIALFLAPIKKESYDSAKVINLKIQTWASFDDR